MRLPEASQRIRHVSGREVFARSRSGTRSFTANQQAAPSASTATSRAGSAGRATVTSAAGVTSVSRVSLRHTASASAKRASPRPPRTGRGTPFPIGTVIETVRSPRRVRGIARTSAASPFGAKASGVT